MILKKMGYYEYPNDDRYWEIKPFELGRINLLVAKNATGKTRTLKAVNCLGTMIKDNVFNDHVNYDIEFVDNDNEDYQYLLSNDDKKIVFEKLIGNKKNLLQRNEIGKGNIYTKEFERNVEFQIPKNKLAISRRDILQYPYLEKIHEWAESVRHYSFGSSMKQEYGSSEISAIANNTYDNPVEMFITGERESEREFSKGILHSMNAIGYDLNIVDVKRGLYTNQNVRFDDYTLYAHEKDRNAIVTQNAMSQGMFRALSILIHISYYAMLEIPTTVLIDDVGEGLDFDRSSKLINQLIELAEINESIQLIMSTNDRYVMNNVPLEYWQVIQRKGSECQVYNYQNSKEIFDEFTYTGLNNFDFLATDFINFQKETK